jgi:hypothetical protein
MSQTPGRRGLTVIELTFASLIMAMIAGALVSMSSAVQTANGYGQTYGTATQHARVALERIDRTVCEAYGKGIYPGVWVTADSDSQWTYPNTVIIWHPAGTPANAAGPPLVQELIAFCPDPNTPNHLVQITWPGNTTPWPSDTPSQTTLIDSLKMATTANKVVLTPLLAVNSTGGGSGVATQRGAAWFVVTLTPSAAAWSSYQTGATAWTSLPWVLGIHSSSTGEGLRQVWLRSELQLSPTATSTAIEPTTNPGGATTVPFWGSSCFYYGLP